MKINLRCTSVEKGKGDNPDHVILVSRDRQPDDPADSSRIKGVLTLELDDPAERGKFEAGKNYSIELSEA